MCITNKLLCGRESAREGCTWTVGVGVIIIELNMKQEGKQEIEVDVDGIIKSLLEVRTAKPGKLVALK